MAKSKASLRSKRNILINLETTDLDDKHDIWEILTNELQENSEGVKDKIELVHIGEYADQIQEWLNNYGKVVGLSSGYSMLDQLTKGFEAGEMTIIGGETSQGKTLLGVNIAYNVAERGIPVLFVTLEMTHKELGGRFAKLHGGADNLPSLPVLFQKRDELDWKNVDPLIEAAVAEGCKMVVIDHLHHFTRELENVSEDLGRITKEFSKNANRHNIPIVMMSHVRKISDRSKAVGNDDLRGSSYIAQDADVVLFISRVPKDSEHAIDGDSFAVRITKNRNRGMPHEQNVVQFKFDNLRLTQLRTL